MDQNSSSTLKPRKSLLKAAREIIDTKGWTRGVLRNVHDEFCINGALWAASGEMPMVNGDPGLTNEYPGPEKDLLKDILGPNPFVHLDSEDVYPYFGSGYYELWEWNDIASRTKEDVLQLLDEAIAAPADWADE